MTPDLEQLAAALGPYGATIITVASALMVLRVALKPFSAKLQSTMERALVRVADTADPNDDRIATRLLSSKPYRLFAFLIDMLFSVKLPLQVTPGEPPISTRGH